MVSGISADIDVSDHGPIWVPTMGPPPDDDGNGTQAVTVGALTGPGDPVAVTYKSEAEALDDAADTGDASQIGLNLEGDLEPGTYKGKVDLDPQDPAAGSVDLELKVSRGWFLAALALLAGIVVGTLLTAASGRMVPSARLRGRVAALSKRCEEATAGLSRADGGGKKWNRFTIGNLPGLQAGLVKKIEEASEKVLIQIEKPALEGIEAEIGAVEVKIDGLAEVPKHARALEAALQLQRAVNLPKAREERPVLEVAATKALEGRSIDADALKAQLDEMDGAAKDVKRIRHLERALETAWLELQDLRGPNGTQLLAIQRVLEDAQNDLWGAESEDEIEGADKKLEKAREELAEAWREKQTTPSPRVSFAFRSPEGTEEAIGEFAAEAITPQPRPPLRSELFLSDSTEPEPPASLPSVGEAVEKARHVQLAIIILSGLVAIAAGLGVLYVGKTWGTVWDFIVAFIWGITGQAVVTTLATSLDSLAALNRLRRS